MSGHGAIWVDQDEARVFRVHLHPLDAFESSAAACVVRVAATPDAPVDAAVTGKGTKFHREVLHALDGAKELLVLGYKGRKAPRAGVLRFLLGQHHLRVASAVAKRAPTDAQLIAYAKWHFRTSSRQAAW